jgi:hypothetical protein
VTPGEKKLARRKRRLAKRLDRRNRPAGRRPVFGTAHVTYEVSEKTTATSAGGVAAAHVLAKKLGLVDEIDRTLQLLKAHLPYHESDHVMNIAYNIMAGGTKLEDMELLRQDEPYMDSLGAARVPDPTTAGDFLRRFSALDVIALMDAVNRVRAGLWRKQPREFRRLGVIDADGTVAPTGGEKKLGMGLNHKGIWGYHPLLVSLANTKEPLFIVNRPGNCVSHDDAAMWIDRAVELARGAFDEVLVRGDTDFSLTEDFDRWTEGGVKFVFGYDACRNLVETADSLPDSAWWPLAREGRAVKTRGRETRENVKDEIVREKGFENIRLVSEEIAEFAYRPARCRKTYRMIVVRKDLTRERGEIALLNEIRYFFYVTNDSHMTAEQVVGHANARCDQENLYHDRAPSGALLTGRADLVPRHALRPATRSMIQQLKNGVNALRVPVYDLVSNWAYMVIASLAWTLKAWMGLVQPRVADRDDLLRMEFKRFLNCVMRIPCQVVRTARRVIVRVLGYTDRVRLLFETVAAARRLCRSGVT